LLKVVWRAIKVRGAVNESAAEANQTNRGIIELFQDARPNAFVRLCQEGVVVEEGKDFVI
jgi:hypothetical protein